MRSDAKLKGRRAPWSPSRSRGLKRSNEDRVHDFRNFRKLQNLEFSCEVQIIIYLVFKPGGFKHCNTSTSASTSINTIISTCRTLSYLFAG
jgi:hypothetical protein